MRLISIIILLFLLISNYTYAENDDKANKIGSFTAIINNGVVELNWTIINPANLNKFKIENKKAGTDLFTSITDVIFSNFRKKEVSDSLMVYYYTYSDQPQENGVYYYKLNVYDIFNKVVATEEIKLGITEVPEFKLNQNNPNPFNPSTLITYQLLIPSHVKLVVYSLTGQMVDQLVDAYQSPGSYTIEFNTARYKELSSGIYFYKLESSYTTDIKKMIFTK